MKRSLPACALLSLLAACGGGSGGTGDAIGEVQPFTSFGDISSNETVVLEGTTRTTSISPRSGGVIAFGAIEANDDASANVRYRNNLLSRLAVRGSGADITIDEDNGGEFTHSGIAISGESGSGSSQVVVLVDPDAAGLDYQTFAYWAKAGSSPGMGVGSFGARTGAANMPSGTTATYSGDSIGYVDGATGDYITEANVAATTDFRDVTVVSANTRVFDALTGIYLGTAGDLDFVTTGAIDQDRFAATIREPDLNGRLDGRFYGPGAEELGGTFEAEGSRGTYIGSFGAGQ